jgi:disulfide bond formation protein DsbB
MFNGTKAVLGFPHLLSEELLHAAPMAICEFCVYARSAYAVRGIILSISSTKTINSH